MEGDEGGGRAARVGWELPRNPREPGGMTHSCTLASRSPSCEGPTRSTGRMRRLEASVPAWCRYHSARGPQQWMCSRCFLQEHSDSLQLLTCFKSRQSDSMHERVAKFILVQQMQNLARVVVVSGRLRYHSKAERWTAPALQHQLCSRACLALGAEMSDEAFSRHYPDSRHSALTKLPKPAHLLKPICGVMLSMADANSIQPASAQDTELHAAAFANMAPLKFCRMSFLHADMTQPHAVHEGCVGMRLRHCMLRMHQLQGSYLRGILRQEGEWKSFQLL